MKPAELRKLLVSIEVEGFDYAFTAYSNYDYIDDKLFHKLRKAYLKARRDLADYVDVDADSL